MAINAGKDFNIVPYKKMKNYLKNLET
jgi:hypothetical protein